MAALVSGEGKNDFYVTCRGCYRTQDIVFVSMKKALRLMPGL